MNATLATLALAALLSACGPSDPISEHLGDRYVNKEQHYSVTTPNGWEVTLVRGSSQFAPRAKTANNAKHTIVVRETRKPPELREGSATSIDDVVNSTERVLRALPQANLGDRKQLSDSELAGALFSLTFTPRGLQSPYLREQAVLVGSKHIYHVIYTAPAGELFEEPAFKTMVASFHEEGAGT